MKTYTVHELAELSGVSVRTLHYYDEIGLLNPSFVAQNGYRHYCHAELVLLQQILFYRELDMPLTDIKRILKATDFRIIESLKKQRLMLKAKDKRLHNLLITINRTITRMTKQQAVPDEEMYDAFKDPDVAEYQDEAKERWGNTDAYKASQEKVSKMTKSEMEKMKADGIVFNKKLAAAMDKDVASAEVQALVQEHYNSIKFFYPCSLEMYRGLAKMYIADDRFKKNYDKFRPGLAQFLYDAIVFYCNRNN